MKDFSSRPYDGRHLWKTLMWIAITSIAMRLTNGAIAVVFPIIAFSALASGNMVQLFFLFMLMIGAQVGNTFFFPKNFIYVMSVRATLVLLAFLLTTKLAGHRHSRFVTPFMGLLPYLIWECVSSAQGYAPIISYLKITLFTVIYFSYYAIANATVSSVSTDPRKIRSVVLAFACLFIIGSVILIPFPGIGLMSQADVNSPDGLLLLDSLFKGMSMHSQSLGPLIATFSVLVFGDLLFAIRKMDKLYLVLLIACPFLVWKTSSRTALGTYIAGMMVVSWFFLRARHVGAQWKGKIFSMLWLIIIALSIGVLAIPNVRNSTMRFVLKMGTNTEKVTSKDVTFDKIASSRLGLVDECLNNFKKKPLLGNGFQVSESTGDVARNGFLSYLSAPIEKGVWYAAVLEEGGAVGFGLFVLFLISAFNSLVKRHAYITASCFFTLVLSNFGEFTFFSMTYTGGLVWAMVFAAAVLDSHRVSYARLEMQI